MADASPSPAEAARPARKGKARAIGRPAGKRSIGKVFLIERTIDLLRATPPEKLSLSMAARHAGVHLTLFKYYFNDRTRLLVDVARDLAKLLGDTVAAIDTGGRPAPERLRIRIDTMVDFFFANPHYHRLMVEIIGDESDPLARELISLWMDKTLDIYREIIDTGVREGTLRPIDPYFTFVAIMGLCEQFQHAARLVRQDAPSGEAAIKAESKRYKSYIYDLLLHGFAA